MVCRDLPVVLGIAAGATLCGMRGYKAISDWANSVGQKARERFGCRRENGHSVVPSEFVIRDCLVRLAPQTLDQALNAWDQACGVHDDALAMDGKTMNHARDEAGQQSHIMERDIALLFETCGVPDFVEVMPLEQGRIETRRIGCSTALNAYLDFPHVGQYCLIERGSIDKRTAVHRREIALGITSRTPQQASPQRVLAVNRGHWSIESVHYIIDWHYDEDRSRIRTGFGPENITRLRRFAVGILKSFQKPAQSIAAMMRALCFRTRLVFDYLRMTQNSSTGACPQ